MGRTSRVVIVEVPGMTLPGTGFTAQHPGVTLDTISGQRVEKDGDVFLPMLMMIKGAKPADLEDLLARIGKVFGKPVVTREDKARRLWVGRITVRESVIPSPAVQAILQFQDRFGVPWAHAEGGVLHVRALINTAEDADKLVQQMRGYLAEQKVDGQVESQEVAPHDYSVWDELVQYSLGLST
jgi:hypothetical protein